MMKMTRWFAALFMAVFLAACGGGGGSPGTTSAGTGTGGSGGGTGTGTGTTTTGSPAVVASIVDGSGNAASALIGSGAFFAQAKVTDATGAAVASKLVTFQVANSSLATLNPATALTDASGVAKVGISPASGSVSGATTLTASATIGTSSVTGSLDFSVTGTGTPPSVAPTVAVSIIDGSGNAATSLTVGGSFRAQALVTDGSGAPVASRLVAFTVSNGGIATVSPGTALTNAAGLAQVSIAPSSITSLGAATLSANATIGSTAVTGSKDFSVSASNLSLSAISLGSTSLASGGNTPVSVTALIGGSPAAATPVNIAFAASCGRINNQSSFSATTNGSGVASVSYNAVNADGTLCSGPVTISASTPGANPQSATVTVANPVANAITFVSANPAQIFVKGSGAAEQSLVTFKVLSGNTPMTNIPVNFNIVTNPGGVGLGATGATGQVTVTTDAQGLASVSVFSGTIPGPVKVRASLVSDATVFAESQNLTVSSGPPSQRFMSLSAETFNIEGWNTDGVSTTITARLADRQGNPVDDGTVVNFTTEGGQVASSCATQKLNGISQCSVTFVSQNPRLDPNGRFSVLAYASGTKDYDDINGNNIYDAGVDTLHDIGDAYRDDNENGSFEAGEFVIPRGGALSCSGSGEPFPGRANTCDGKLATTVRQQLVILFSSSNAASPVLNTFNTGAIDFFLGSADHPNLPMPAGTTVSADASGATCTVDKNFNPAVPNVDPGTNPNANLQSHHVITFKGCMSGDRVALKITTPAGKPSIFTYTFP